jgi:hypothetical protein
VGFSITRGVVTEVRFGDSLVYCWDCMTMGDWATRPGRMSYKQWEERGKGEGGEGEERGRREGGMDNDI